jgi:drug/metabolite transporter (DMT)-like permease
MHFASLAALAMMLGLMRWPSIHWELAKGYATAGAEQQALFEALFLGLNRYLGNYIGEFLGELSINVFFLLSGAAISRARGTFPRWVGYLGVLTALAGMVGMFRNVTSAVAVVAEVNNYLLPLWMIVFGIALLRARPSSV